MSDARFHEEHVPNSPKDEWEINAELEQLDDVIFPAIDGNKPALQMAETAWNNALQSLGPETVQETRREYLRYARRTWDFLTQQSIKHPERILAVAKLILMLSGEDGGMDV